MTADLLLRASVGLLPVLCFLAGMRAFDSYKLVRIGATLSVIAAGGLAAAASYAFAGAMLDRAGLDFTTYSRWIAPLVEEVAKGAVIVWMIRAHRIVFLVDAAIFGFAVGAGFAVVENLVYLARLPDATLGVWIVRGFGTALMHGGATAVFGMAGLVLSERADGTTPLTLAPGLLGAALLHSAYNHVLFTPVLATIGVVVLLPPVLLWVFERSEAGLEDWLEVGFDADAELLSLIDSGRLSDSKVGRHLESLRERFHGPVVADLLCYLRVRTELALRAKGILMMRESGFDAAPDDATRARFAELEYLEKSIGPTGLLAIKPFLHFSRKDLWQLYQIGS